MKVIEFQDLDGQKLRVQQSSLATQEAFRIYVEGPDILTEKDKATGHEIPVCIHLTRPQAEILINALQDLFSE